MIIVRPTAGLCNRMRVINSSICLARENGIKKIKVIWEANDLLKAHFEDLFEPIEEVVLIDKSFYLNFHAYYKNKTIKKRTLKEQLKSILLKQFTGSYKYYDDDNIMSFRFNVSHWNNNHRNVVFNTCEEFLSVFKRV